jgi:serine/threonine protein phosphatase PrpC
MLECFGLTNPGCIRRNNEDYCRLEPDFGVYALADGMGGANAGEQASKLAVDSVVDQLCASKQRDSQVLLAAVEEANRRVLLAAQQDPALDGMGTTLLVAMELGKEVAIASVGDSRAYLLDSGGLYIVTRDQTWVNDVGRPLGLDEESLKHHPMRHVLTMAIGAAGPLSINYYTVQLGPSALLLLSSDGLHGVVDVAEIERMLRQDGSLEDKCAHLIEAARKAGGPDNITAVLLRNSAR